MNLRADTPQFAARRMVRAPLVGLATLLILASLALLVVVLLRPGESGRFLRWWLLFATAAILGTTAIIIARVLPAQPRRTDHYGKPHRSALVEPPGRLQQIDRMLTSATWSGREYRGRLRPLLLTIATQRLQTHRGVDSEQTPEAAIAILGPEIWEQLTTPVAAAGSEGRGLTVAQIARIVATLEDVGGTDNNRR